MKNNRIRKREKKGKPGKGNKEEDNTFKQK